MSPVLLRSTALGLVMLTAGPTFAQDTTVTETDDLTTPVTTSGAGSPTNYVLDPAGSITLTTGDAALTLDSDTNVLIDGQIVFDNVSDAVGVRIAPGVTGEVVNDGTLNFQGPPLEDANEDGIADTPYATDPVGILLDAGGTFTGQITNNPASTIAIEGEGARAISILGDLDGDLTTSGTITVNDSVGGSAVVVEGDITGQYTHNGAISVRAYEDTTPDGTFDDVQTARQPGPAVGIGGNVSGGILLNGPSVDEADAADAAQESGSGEVVEFTPSSSITISGDQPAVLISPTVASTPGDIEIGALADDGDSRADTDVEGGPYSVIARGSINAQGIYDGVASEAVRIEGGGGFTTNLSDGFRNEGSIAANADEADSTGLVIGAGATTTISNVDTITASSEGDGVFTATAVRLEAGALVSEFENEGIISARATGPQGGATAIGGAPTSDIIITNRALISTVLVPIDDGDDTNGVETADGPAYAVDLAGATADVELRSRTPDDFAPVADDGEGGASLTSGFGNFLGDVRLGAGNDRVDLQAGGILGDIDFGAGDDELIIANGAGVRGRITDPNGTLSIQVGTAPNTTTQLVEDQFGGTLTLEGSETLNIADATFYSDSRLILTVDELGGRAANLNASGTITVEPGATITPLIDNTFPDQITLDVLTAGTLNLVEGADSIQLGDLPFLVNASLGVSPTNANVLQLTIVQKDTAALGLAEGLGGALEPLEIALEGDTDLLREFANIVDGDEFRAAYKQFLPDLGDASFQIARAMTDSITGATAGRLDMYRRGEHEAMGYWIQEIAYYFDRSSTDAANGYDGGGFGFALGADVPIGNLGAVGATFGFSSAKFDESEGADLSSNALIYEIGVYGGTSVGPLALDGQIAFGWADYDSSRIVEFDDVMRPAAGEWGGSHFAASFRAAYDYEFGRNRISPTLAFDILNVDEDAYDEVSRVEGEEAILLGLSDRSYDSTSGYFGVDLSRRWSPTSPASLRATLGWRQPFSTDAPEFDVRFLAGGETFTLTGTDPDDSSAVVGLGYTYAGENLVLDIGYGGEFGDEFTRHGLRGGIRVHW